MKSLNCLDKEVKTLEILIRFLFTNSAIKNRVSVYEYTDKNVFVFSSILLEKFMCKTCSLSISKTLDTPIIRDIFIEKLFDNLKTDKYDDISYKFLKNEDVNRNVKIVLYKKSKYWVNESSIEILGEKVCFVIQKFSHKIKNGKKILFKPSTKTLSDTEIIILGLNNNYVKNIIDRKTSMRLGCVITEWKIDNKDHRKVLISLAKYS